MLINEADLRARWHRSKANVIHIPAGSILTPSARDFLRGNNIRVEIEGHGWVDLDLAPLSTSKASLKAIVCAKKPEHMTHLRGDQLVPKTHPIIAWRGQMDEFDCAIVESQIQLVR